MVGHPCLPPTNCRPMSKRSSPTTAPLNLHLSTAGRADRASNRVGYSILSCVMPKLINVVSKGELLKCVDESSLAHLKSSQRFLAANRSTPLTSNATTSHRVRAMDD